MSKRKQRKKRKPPPPDSYNQTNLIHRMDWDILCVLDAARFDYFKRRHKHWLKGKLHKAISPGSNTPTWLKRTWPKYYDLIYFSANPYINTQGYPIDGYMAKTHFREIVDVWHFGWSNKLGTVHPREMNKAVASRVLKGKTVIHYVQPHRPYIGRSGQFARPGSIFRQRILNQPMPPKGTRRPPPRHLTKKAYTETLDLVLIHIAKLVPHLKGKIVITADHGEALGEQGLWGKHPPALKIPALREVPWFIMKGGAE